VSAILEGRRFIGIEKNQDVMLFKKNRIDYLKICSQRINDAQNQYKSEKAQLTLF